MRASLLLVLTLGAPPPARTDEAAAIVETKLLAGQFAFFGERCRHNETGGWEKGTWVMASSNALCGHYRLFDRHGALLMESACCEGTCRPPLPRLGPASRDLCKEALAELSDAGVAMAASEEASVREVDGGVVFPLPGKVRRWPLHPGRFDVVLAHAAIAFEVAPDGRTVTSRSDAGVVREPDGRCMIGDLAFFPCGP